MLDDRLLQGGIGLPVFLARFLFGLFGELDGDFFLQDFRGRLLEPFDVLLDRVEEELFAALKEYFQALSPESEGGELGDKGRQPSLFFLKDLQDSLEDLFRVAPIRFRS